MTRILNIQTCGSIVVTLTFIASEMGADFLSAHPGSPFAWYLNLEVFRAFEWARAGTSPLRHLFGPAALPGAVMLLGCIALARAARARFGVALLANLSFVFTIALIHAGAGGGASPSGAASLVPMAFRGQEDGMLIGLMLVASFSAFAVSHASFLAAIVAQGRTGNA